MKRLHALRLDHGRRTPRWLRLPALALAGAAAASGAVALYAFGLADQAAQLEQQAEMRGQAGDGAALARRARHAAGIAAPADERLAAQIRAELGMPWERLFGAIEGAAGPDVSLLSLTPGGARLTLGGEARDMDALLAFLKRLQGSGAYASVYLREHHVDAADAQRAVRFSMELKWERGI
jgi:hypothetical protein